MPADADPEDSAPGFSPGATKGEQTRSQVLASAIECFGRDGYRSTSVADIARRAGVGGTVAYAYFANKEALFLAALDEDAAAVIHEAIPTIESATDEGWTASLLARLLQAMDRHPLARRVLSGLEPHVTSRMAELPALTELRKALADRLHQDQLDGLVRPDIDPVAISSGAVTVVLSLLMSALQFGPEGVEMFAPDVLALFDAAIRPVTP